MKKIIEKLNKNRNLIIGIVVGAVAINLIGIISSIAASTVQSNIVLYDSVTGKKNVKDAIDELYTMANTHCPDGYTCSKLSTLVPPTASDTHLGIMYLDPTDLNKKCDASNSINIQYGGVTNEGCMKWYIYNETGTYYNLILGHNTTGRVDTFDMAQTQVRTDTKNWIRSLNPRNISANEIWEITKSTNGKSDWTQSNSSSEMFYFEGIEKSGTGTSKYAWLYDYTYDCTLYGCDSAAFVNVGHGYWTQNEKDRYNGWVVSHYGLLTDCALDGNYQAATVYGVRPVITIPKS